MIPDPGREHMMEPRPPYRPEAGMAVHVRASFATFEFDGRAVVDAVHLKKYPDSPLIAVRLGPPKGRKRRAYVTAREILGPWEET